jgi:S-adenosylmethionine:tRNA ribosyltransferase-isomerase
VEPRDLARMMVVYREGPFRVAHRRVRDLPEFLRPGDLLVFNESKVIPARLLARKPTGGRVEVLLVRERAPGLWEALLGPARRAPVGTELSFLSPRDWRPVPGLKAEVVGVEADGVRLLQIQGDLLAHLEEVGEVPLPPTSRPRFPWSATRPSTPSARAPWPPPRRASTSPRSFWKDFGRWGWSSTS